MKPSTMWQQMLQRPFLTSAIALSIGGLSALTVPSSYATMTKKLAQSTHIDGQKATSSYWQGAPGPGQPPPGGFPNPNQPAYQQYATGSYPQPYATQTKDWERGNFGQPDEKHEAEFERRRQEEDRRQEETDKRQQEMEARQLEQMKRGLAQMERHLTRSRNYFEKNTSKGVAIPQECTSALDTLQKILAALKAATNFEEAQNAGIEDMQEHFQVLNECRMRVEMLARIPQILKQIDREIARMERQWIRAKRNAPADAAEIVQEGDALFQSIKDARAKVDLNVTTIDELRETFDETVFSKFDDLGSIIQRLEAARNARKFLSFIPRMLRNMEQGILAAKKAGNDTAKLSSIVNDIKAQYEVVKKLKPGSEEFQTAIDAIAELGQSFAEAAGTEDGFGQKYFGPQGGPGGGRQSGPQGGPGGEFNVGQFMHNFQDRPNTGP